MLYLSLIGLCETYKLRHWQCVDLPLVGIDPFFHKNYYVVLTEIEDLLQRTTLHLSVLEQYWPRGCEIYPAHKC